MFSRLSVGLKLFLGFAMVLLVTFGLGEFAIQRMSAMHAATGVVTTNALPSTILFGQMRSLVEKVRLRDARLIPEGSLTTP